MQSRLSVSNALDFTQWLVDHWMQTHVDQIQWQLTVPPAMDFCCQAILLIFQNNHLRTDAQLHRLHDLHVELTRKVCQGPLVDLCARVYERLTWMIQLKQRLRTPEVLARMRSEKIEACWPIDWFTKSHWIVYYDPKIKSPKISHHFFALLARLDRPAMLYACSPNTVSLVPPPRDQHTTSHIQSECIFPEMLQRPMVLPIPEGDIFHILAHVTRPYMRAWFTTDFRAPFAFPAWTGSTAEMDLPFCSPEASWEEADHTLQRSGYFRCFWGWVDPVLSHYHMPDLPDVRAFTPLITNSRMLVGQSSWLHPVGTTPASAPTESLPPPPPDDVETMDWGDTFGPFELDRSDPLMHSTAMAAAVEDDGVVTPLRTHSPVQHVDPSPTVETHIAPTVFQRMMQAEAAEKPSAFILGKGVYGGSYPPMADDASDAEEENVLLHMVEDVLVDPPVPMMNPPVVELRAVTPPPPPPPKVSFTEPESDSDAETTMTASSRKRSKATKSSTSRKRIKGGRGIKNLTHLQIHGNLQQVVQSFVPEAFDRELPGVRYRVLMMNVVALDPVHWPALFARIKSSCFQQESVRAYLAHKLLLDFTLVRVLRMHGVEVISVCDFPWLEENDLDAESAPIWIAPTLVWVQGAEGWKHALDKLPETVVVDVIDGCSHRWATIPPYLMAELKKEDAQWVCGTWMLDGTQARLEWYGTVLQQWSLQPGRFNNCVIRTMFGVTKKSNESHFVKGLSSVKAREMYHLVVHLYNASSDKTVEAVNQRFDHLQRSNTVRVQPDKAPFQVWIPEGAAEATHERLVRSVMGDVFDEAGDYTPLYSPHAIGSLMAVQTLYTQSPTPTDPWCRQLIQLLRPLVMTLVQEKHPRDWTSHQAWMDGTLRAMHQLMTDNTGNVHKYSAQGGILLLSTNDFIA
jgi:hypothetical protein